MKRVVLSYGECTYPHLTRAVDIGVAYSVSNSLGSWRVSLRVERACPISRFVAYVRNSQLTAVDQLAITWDLQCSPFWDSYASLAGSASRRVGPSRPSPRAYWRCKVCTCNGQGN